MTERDARQALARWVADRGGTAAAGEALAITRHHVRALVVGRRRPGRHVALRLMQLADIPIGAWDRAAG